MLTQSLVDEFLGQKSLAVAGVSRSGKKFGHMVLKELTRKGYDLSVVHPAVNEIDGHKCYASIAELPPEVKGLVLVVPPAQSEKIVQEVPASGIKYVWMQQGSESPAAIQFCSENDIALVHGECILMYAQPQGMHKFHHWLWGLLGKGPTA